VITNSLLSYALLTGASVSYINAASRLEHLRLAVSRRHVPTMLGIFTFAGVVSLPLPLSVLLAVTVYAAAWPTFRKAGTPAHRWAYNAGAVSTACAISSVVSRLTPTALSIPAGIITFVGINFSLVAAAIVTARHKAAYAMLRNPRTHAVVVGTQVLGALVGELITWHRPAGLVVLPALYAFHLWAARGTVKDTKSFHTAAGVWSGEAWLALVENAIADHKWFSVLMIDAGGPTNRERVVRELRARGLLGPGDAVGCHADPTMIVAMLVNTPGAIARMVGKEITSQLATTGLDVAIGCADSRKAKSLHATLMNAYGDAVIQRAHSIAQPERL
jgi:hypothetical protein